MQDSGAQTQCQTITKAERRYNMWYIELGAWDEDTLIITAADKGPGVAVHRYNSHRRLTYDRYNF